MELLRPYVLDDRTVERVVSVFTAQRDDLWLFEEQLRRWSEQGLGAEQRREVSRLSHQLESLRQVIVEILTLAENLKHGTIERVLSRVMQSWDWSGCCAARPNESTETMLLT